MEPPAATAVDISLSEALSLVLYPPLYGANGANIWEGRIKDKTMGYQDIWMRKH